MTDQDKVPRRMYGRFIPECRARGIGRSFAFELKKNGLLETFKIGAGTFIFIDSLDTLPGRLAERDQKVAA